MQEIISEFLPELSLFSRSGLKTGKKSSERLGQLSVLSCGKLTSRRKLPQSVASADCDIELLWETKFSTQFWFKRQESRRHAGHLQQREAGQVADEGGLEVELEEDE